MKPTISSAFPRHLATGVAVALAVASSLAQAQQVYRIVGPDGKVTFSDKPPVAASKGSSATTTAASSADAGSGRLPYELDKVARQFPVVLYSGKDCAPCNSGRNMLINRGIPFAEKTVENSESIEALKQFSGQGSLPVLTIGSQHLKGFSDTSWTQYLNAAGYPEKSALPSSYKRPSPAPLAEAKAVVTNNPAAKSRDPAPKTEAPATPETPVASPNSGIRF